MLRNVKIVCDQCGGPMYDDSGLIVLDDSGVVDEAANDASLLASVTPLQEMAMRTRMLELTG